MSKIGLSVPKHIAGDLVGGVYFLESDPGPLLIIDVVE